MPKICVVVRKAYGAGLYAMAGPGFEPDATIALPTAKIAVMGAEAAVNAVYANKIAAIEDEAERAAFVAASARRVRARHRHRAAGQRAGRRRDRRAGGPARRADPAATRRRAARTARSPAAGTASPPSEVDQTRASCAASSVRSGSGSRNTQRLNDQNRQTMPNADTDDVAREVAGQQRVLVRGRTRRRRGRPG